METRWCVVFLFIFVLNSKSNGFALIHVAIVFLVWISVVLRILKKTEYFTLMRTRLLELAKRHLIAFFTSHFVSTRAKSSFKWIPV